MARNGKPQTSSNAQGKEKPEKKKSGAGKAVAGGGIIAALIAAMLFFFNGGLGFGGGDSSGLKKDSEKNDTAVTESVTAPESKETETPEEDPTADGNVEISVSGSTIKVDGKEISDAAALKEYLTSINKDNVKYSLKDNDSIKADYDAVKAVLDGMNLEYTTE